MQVVMTETDDNLDNNLFEVLSSSEHIGVYLSVYGVRNR